MKHWRVVVVGIAVLLLTGCERLFVGAVSTVKPTVFAEHGVICYTFASSISCVAATVR